MMREMATDALLDAYSALIVVGDETPSVFGLNWIEFAARTAVRAGATHIVVVAPRVPQGIVATLDRLRSEALVIELVREPHEAAGRFDEGERVLLIAGTGVLDDATLGVLVRADRPTIGVLPADASEVFERIDADSQWTGHALIESGLIQSTAASVGDWDLGSTLLRSVIQRGADRLPVALAMVATAAGSGQAIASARVESAKPQFTGLGGTWLVDPASALLARLTATKASLSIRLAPVLGSLLIVAMLVVAWHGLIAPVAAIALLLVIVSAAASRMAAAVGLHLWSGHRGSTAIPIVTAIAFIIAVVRYPDFLRVLPLALTVVAFHVLLARLPRQSLPRWCADLAGQAVVLCIGVAIPAVGPVAMLAVLAIYAFVSVASAQMRLSRALTQSD